MKIFGVRNDEVRKNQYLLFRLQNYIKIIKQTLHFELKYVKLLLHLIIHQITSNKKNSRQIALTAVFYVIYL